MNKIDTMREQVSALADGRLSGDEFARVVTALCSDEELRRSWQTYHVVGDVLRSGKHSPCADSSAFLSGFRQKLDAEPAIAISVASVSRVHHVEPVRADAANEPVFRWKLVAGAASLAAAAAIGWNWVGSASRAPDVQLAQQAQQSSILASSSVPSQTNQGLALTQVVVGNGQPQMMLRDPRLDQLLEAHQQAGGASQMPSGFLRNATFEGPSR